MFAETERNMDKKKNSQKGAKWTREIRISLDSEEALFLRQEKELVSWFDHELYVLFKNFIY